mmetsp:Transcript_1368/g.3200  ORF Transcript_1368/g.3200 Transcript_1368/m.3200 type:complete len:420 (-) Transcript_1368:60-1319(-)
MTSYGIWDGSSCANCEEQSPYEDNGYDSDTPCEQCGWYRASISGERYPPGWCASSWRLATRRIDELRQEFPDYSKEMIAQTVLMAGEDDVDGHGVRENLDATKASEKLCEEFPDVEPDSIVWVVSMLRRKDVNILYDFDAVREILCSLKAKREEAKARQKEGTFDYDFDLADGEITIEILQRLNGCFHCGEEGARKRCTKCKVAVYCNRECQALSWKDKRAPHKLECKAYCENRAPAREGSDKGPIPIALCGIHLLDCGKVLEIAMEKRTIAFLDEVKRSCDEPRYIGLQVAVLWNLDMARLQASASVIDGEMNRNDVNVILFKPVGVETHLQGMIHPFDGGAGDIPEGARKKVLAHLKKFLKQAEDRGIEVANITCNRATLWLCEPEGRSKLIAANSGRNILISPGQNYILGNLNFRS